MKIIENNPFRVLGIISNSSAKETKESETFILRYLDIGKSADLKFDITPPLIHLERTAEIVKSAKRQIHDDLDKLTYSIFWFVNGSTVDKIALDKLSSNKDIDKASNIFEKGSRNFEVSKTSFSSIINFSTLEIITYSSHKDEERLKNAIKYKYEIIKNKIVFKEFEKLITSTTNKINHKSYLDRYIEHVKDLLQEIFPRKNQDKLLLDIFSEENSIREEIERQIVSSLVKKINVNIVLFNSFFEIQSEKTDGQIIRSRSTIIKRVKKLVSDTESDLNKLKKAVGKDSYEFSNLVDEVYTKVNNSVIMCFNKDFDALNRQIEISNRNPYGGNVTYPSFKLYIDLLEESSKTISSISCSIKNRLNENLQAIKRLNKQARERERESSHVMLIVVVAVGHRLILLVVVVVVVIKKYLMAVGLLLLVE